jgi:N4-bis(aminopropyl)spermidine synthase
MSGVDIVADVAGAVALAEGEAGVLDVVRTVARGGSGSVRAISRSTELPVPLVSAICNELRRHGVVAREPPVRLTPRGLDLFGDVNGRVAFAARCRRCDGRGITVPRPFSGILRELRQLAQLAPAARAELDQCHCTVETKIRRVLAMYEAGALGGRRVVLLGDDDLTSLALKLVVERLGRPAALRGLVVVDVDPAVIDFLGSALSGSRFVVGARVHDLREPLPADLVGIADTVFTDPPYTNAGAELFLSRAAEAAGGRPGRDVFLSFGACRPADALALQRAIAEMGFVVRRLVPNFNDYVGAGVRAGTSHLYQLRTTSGLRATVRERYDGPIYTGERVARQRRQVSSR